MSTSIGHPVSGTKGEQNIFEFDEMTGHILKKVLDVADALRSRYTYCLTVPTGNKF